MSALAKVDSQLRGCEGATEAVVAPERARRLRLVPIKRELAAIAEQARIACGLEKAQMADELKIKRRVICAVESANDVDHYVNLRMLLDAPDAYVDSTFRAFAIARLKRGHAARMWAAAPEVVHTDDATRINNVAVGLCEVMRACMTGAPAHEVIAKTEEGIEVLQELKASRIAQIR